jgi:hypothetical protein
MINSQLTITKADEGKTLATLTQDEYKHKINYFIHDNQFTTTENSPIQYYQNATKQALKQ